VIFKALVLQALYNLSDDQAEYQLRDRFSFMRFLGLELEDAVPDAKTLWLYREALAKAGAVEELFDLFDGFLKNRAISPVAGRSSMRRSCRRPSNTIRARTTRRTRKAKRRKTGNPSLPRTARRTRTRAGRRSINAPYFGYKNHIGIDRRHKFVQRYVVSDASEHDSQKLEDVFDAGNTALDVWAESTCAWPGGWASGTKTSRDLARAIRT
jgi:transposase, IS5 family